MEGGAAAAAAAAAPVVSHSNATLLPFDVHLSYSIVSAFKVMSLSFVAFYASIGVVVVNVGSIFASHPIISVVVFVCIYVATA